MRRKDLKSAEKGGKRKSAISFQLKQEISIRWRGSRDEIGSP
jgi:hypothetical protein